MARSVSFPTTIVENKEWILLKHISDSWIIRAEGMDKIQRKKEKPSGHRVDEVGAEGSVKCRPRKEWDLTNYKAD